MYELILPYYYTSAGKRVEAKDFFDGNTFFGLLVT